MTRPVNVPVMNSSPIWRKVKKMRSPTAAAPGLLGAKPMASAIPRPMGTPRAMRVEPLGRPALRSRPVPQRTRLWFRNRGGRRWSDSSTSRNMSPERETAVPSASRATIMIQAGVPKPARTSGAGTSPGTTSVTLRSSITTKSGRTPKMRRGTVATMDPRVTSPARLSPGGTGMRQPATNTARAAAAPKKRAVDKPAQERGDRRPPLQRGAPGERRLEPGSQGGQVVGQPGSGRAGLGDPALQIPDGTGLDEALVLGEPPGQPVERPRMALEVRRSHEVPRRGQLLGGGREPRGIHGDRALGMVPGQCAEGRIDQQISPVLAHEPRERAQLGERLRGGRPLGDPPEDLRRPATAGEEGRHQRARHRAQRGGGARGEGLSHPAQPRHLLAEHGQPLAESPLDGPGDRPLLSEEGVEAGARQPPHGDVGVGDHGRASRRVGEEGDLPELLTRPEQVDGLAVPGLVPADHDGHVAGVDHVEAVPGVALADDDGAARVAALFQLSGQPGEVQPSELREERAPGERGRGAGHAVRAPRCER